MATYSNSANAVAVLKELYVDNQDYMKDLVYKENPFFALIPKNESMDGMAGKYLPVPLIYGTPQGRSHTFANAQGNQTAPATQAFFVYVIQDYQLVTITNLLMEQTKSSAGAFVDSVKLNMDTGIRNITNNIAFEIFNDGTGNRGQMAASSGFSYANPIATITLANPQLVVNFEEGMTLVASSTLGGAPSTDTVLLTKVNRITGVLVGTGSASSMSGNWASGGYLSVQGDLPSAGATNPNAFLALTGLAAWLPKIAPTTGDNFWGVDRSVDPTRLAGIRYDGSNITIEEALVNAMALINREGGRPDMCIIDFASYAALVNALSAKVQYVQVDHDEVEVAFRGIMLHSAYGPLTVLADRSCPPQTAYLLQMDCWKLRSLGKVPKVLTYGMEGLEGLRVGNADALEVRMGYYGQLICNAPGFNAVVNLSQ